MVIIFKMEGYPHWHPPLYWLYPSILQMIKMHCSDYNLSLTPHPPLPLYGRCPSALLMITLHCTDDQPPHCIVTLHHAPYPPHLLQILLYGVGKLLFILKDHIVNTVFKFAFGEIIWWEIQFFEVKMAKWQQVWPAICCFQPQGGYSYIISIGVLRLLFWV